MTTLDTTFRCNAQIDIFADMRNSVDIADVLGKVSIKKKHSFYGIFHNGYTPPPPRLWKKNMISETVNNVKSWSADPPTHTKN